MTRAKRPLTLDFDGGREFTTRSRAGSGSGRRRADRRRNIPINRIVEDLIFKESQRSYFIQLADFCAFALLRQENPVPSRSKYGIDKAFATLEPILVREASTKDPLGIIRV